MRSPVCCPVMSMMACVEVTIRQEDVPGCGSVVAGGPSVVRRWASQPRDQLHPGHPGAPTVLAAKCVVTNGIHRLDHLGFETTESYCPSTVASDRTSISTRWPKPAAAATRCRASRCCSTDRVAERMGPPMRPRECTTRPIGADLGAMAAWTRPRQGSRSILRR